MHLGASKLLLLCLLSLLGNEKRRAEKSCHHDFGISRSVASAKRILSMLMNDDILMEEVK